MKILITGGAGYLGSTLTSMLLERSHEVTVYDSFLWGIFPMMSMANLPNLRILKADVRNRDQLIDAMAGQDAIIHLAAIVGYAHCDKDPELAMNTNIIGTRNITEIKSPEQILVFASTGSCYGAVEGICTEETTICPLTLYGRTTAEAESMVLSVGGIALRLATLFGLSLRQRIDLLVNELTYKAETEKTFDLFEGNFRRTFIHVKDAARAFVFAIEHAAVMTGQAYNVGNEKMNMTKSQVAGLIQANVEGCVITESDAGQDNDKRCEVSYAKIRKLGFQSTITVEQGIRDMLKILPHMTPEEVGKCKNI